MGIEKNACAWVVAERERKLRKRESKIAWMLAFKAGVGFVLNGEPHEDDAYLTSSATTDEQRAALALALEAKRIYHAAAAKAGGLRAALSRSSKERPTRNLKVWREFDAFCAREVIAAQGRFTP